MKAGLSLSKVFQCVVGGQKHAIFLQILLSLLWHMKEAIYGIEFRTLSHGSMLYMYQLSSSSMQLIHDMAQIFASCQQRCYRKGDNNFHPPKGGLAVRP